MHIAIAGNIGVGKTTLAEKLAQHFGWDVYYEAVEGNPYLAPFYDDMTKWSFHLQVYFLNSRFEQVLRIKEDAFQPVIQDRSIYEDAYIFALNLHESGIMNETDYATYLGLFKTIMKAVTPPNLMIYLKADTDKLVRQIQLRNRSFEQNIDISYLESLNRLYDAFSSRYEHGPLLEIDVNGMDFVKSAEDFRSITKQVERML